MSERTCPRCGAVAHVVWADATMLGDPEPVLVEVNSQCATDGCVDEMGSRRIDYPTVAELRERADRMWFASQQRMFR